MIGTYFNGLDVLYHRAKFREHCTTRAGCRCENVFFLSRSDAGGLCVRGVRSSNKYCVTVYGSILMQFSPFFEVIGLSDAVCVSYFRR